MIRAVGLEKRYGLKRVLRGLDFELERGGFLVVTGANGAGKTTLLRSVRGLAIPTGGTLEVEPERGLIGFLGHEPLVYRELTALENLDLYGASTTCPSGGSGSGCCSSASGSGRSEASGPRRFRAASCSGWRSRVRSCTSPSC